jgi:hypothetical protein
LAALVTIADSWIAKNAAHAYSSKERTIVFDNIEELHSRVNDESLQCLAFETAMHPAASRTLLFARS